MQGNGCGAEWMPRKVKAMLFDWFFEASCNKHDEGYSEGGNEARRKHCDKMFYAAMKRDSLKHRGAARFVRLAQAAVYYAAVRGFGWMHFNYRDVS